MLAEATTATPLTVANLSESATAEDVLRWGYETYGQKLALVTSFQPTGIVTLHKLNLLGLHIPVLTIDTGLLFPETYELMEQVEERFNLKIQRITPRQTVEEQNESYGPALWERQPDRCCHYRKVLPLRQALAPYEAWITGLRRDQAKTRATVPLVGVDEANNKVKLSPFANWTEENIWAYIHEYNLPYNRLHQMNYPSIGCFTCTKAVQPGEDKRAGRWAGSSKTECGLHFTTTASAD